MAKKKQRTCIRLTCVKDMNMVAPEKYAELISRANPDFVECKSYMFVGSSRQRLSLRNMPWHEEVMAFAQEVASFLPQYEIVAEHTMSRAVLLAKKEWKAKKAKVKGRNGQDEWQTWIDFKKWHELVNSGKEFSSKDYRMKTPEELMMKK
jgi:tRNA wybutosine-synthesizing protein 1